MWTTLIFLLLLRNGFCTATDSDATTTGNSLLQNEELMWEASETGLQHQRNDPDKDYEDQITVESLDAPEEDLDTGEYASKLNLLTEPTTKDLLASDLSPEEFKLLTTVSQTVHNVNESTLNESSSNVPNGNSELHADLRNSGNFTIKNTHVDDASSKRATPSDNITRPSLVHPWKGSRAEKPAKDSKLLFKSSPVSSFLPKFPLKKISVVGSKNFSKTSQHYVVFSLNRKGSTSRKNVTEIDINKQTTSSQTTLLNPVSRNLSAIMSRIQPFSYLKKASPRPSAIQNTMKTSSLLQRIQMKPPAATTRLGMKSNGNFKLPTVSLPMSQLTRNYRAGSNKRMCVGTLRPGSTCNPSRQIKRNVQFMSSSEKSKVNVGVITMTKDTASRSLRTFNPKLRLQSHITSLKGKMRPRVKIYTTTESSMTSERPPSDDNTDMKSSTDRVDISRENASVVTDVTNNRNGRQQLFAPSTAATTEASTLANIRGNVPVDQGTEDNGTDLIWTTEEVVTATSTSVVMEDTSSAKMMKQTHDNPQSSNSYSEPRNIVTTVPVYMFAQYSRIRSGKTEAKQNPAQDNSHVATTGSRRFTIPHHIFPSTPSPQADPLSSSEGNDDKEMHSEVETIQKNDIEHPPLFYTENYHPMLNNETKIHSRTPTLPGYQEQATDGNPISITDHDGLSWSNPQDLQVPVEESSPLLHPLTHGVLNDTETTLTNDSESEMENESRIHATVIENDKTAGNDKPNEGNEALRYNPNQSNVSQVSEIPPGNKPSFKSEKKRYRQYVKVSTTTTTTTTLPTPYSSPSEGLTEEDASQEDIGNDELEEHFTDLEEEVENTTVVEPPPRVNINMETPKRPVSLYVDSSSKEKLLPSNQFNNAMSESSQKRENYMILSSLSRFNSSSLSETTTPISTFPFPERIMSNTLESISVATQPPVTPIASAHQPSQPWFDSSLEETGTEEWSDSMVADLTTDLNERDNEGDSELLKPTEQPPSDENDYPEFESIKIASSVIHEMTSPHLDFVPPTKPPGAESATRLGRPHGLINRQRVSSITESPSGFHTEAVKPRKKSGAISIPSTDLASVVKQEEVFPTSRPIQSRTHPQVNPFGENRLLDWKKPSEFLLKAKSNTSSKRFPVPQTFSFLTKTNVVGNKSTNAPSPSDRGGNKSERLRMQVRGPTQYGTLLPSTLPAAISPQILSKGNRAVVNTTTNNVKGNVDAISLPQQNPSSQNNVHFGANYVENSTRLDYRVRGERKNPKNDQVNQAQSANLQGYRRRPTDMKKSSSQSMISYSPVVRLPPVNAINSHKVPDVHRGDQREHLVAGASTPIAKKRTRPNPAAPDIIPSVSVPTGQTLTSSPFSKHSTTFNVSPSILPGGTPIYHNQPSEAGSKSPENASSLYKLNPLAHEHTAATTLAAPTSDVRYIHNLKPGSSSNPFDFTLQAPQQLLLNSGKPMNAEAATTKHTDAADSRLPPPSRLLLSPPVMLDEHATNHGESETIIRPSYLEKSNEGFHPILAAPMHHNLYDQQVENPQGSASHNTPVIQPYQQGSLEPEPVQEHLSLTQSIINQLMKSMRTSRIFPDPKDMYSIEVYGNTGEKQENAKNLINQKELFISPLNSRKGEEDNVFENVEGLDKVVKVAATAEKEIERNKVDSSMEFLVTPDSSWYQLNSNKTSEENSVQDSFKQPAILERAFPPVKTYSEVDPGPILVKIP